MKALTCTIAVMLALGAAPAHAAPIAPGVIDGPDDGASDQPYLQCVPYARQVSGIQIHGDAWTWWDQAEGRYKRGSVPEVGAVMSFKPYGAMQLGHVAAVSKVIDSRTVLLRHANWSPINGRRGQIEDDVRAVDVSPDNDWSEVRVWFAPINALGTTHWPVNGFIYPEKALKTDSPMTLADARPTREPARQQRASLIGDDFLKGIPADSPSRRAQAPRNLLASDDRYTPARPQRRVAAAQSARGGNDPIGQIISRISR
ncbi:CHAP domain-containing protein [Novosphingobium sp. ZN18A2]|uniref:CHAP domain-containing protein n=1 Tax=Novosphingobium sp. ZN18A2 TaxID=3079861 RepID=UPI0030D5F1D6